MNFPSFRDEKLLSKALLHSSQAKGKGDFDRLEFLGDRVLNLSIAERLYQAYPKEKEGALAKRHSHLVSKPILATIARALKLQDRLIYLKEEGRREDGILADAVEALIGALYLDQGLEAARLFILSHWEPLVKLESHANPKSALQEWAHKKGFSLPQYEILSQTGSDHSPLFTLRVTVGPYEESATGPSKQEASQQAARHLLERLKL